jgi:8-oxo-dGTP pyrophosphatase MutT (NUDIX family)
MQGKESALECALRELFEETGVSLENRIYRGTIKLSKNKDAKNSEYFIYHVDEEMPIVIQDRCEVFDAGWFTLEEMKLMHANIDVSNFCRRNLSL